MKYVNTTILFIALFVISALSFGWDIEKAKEEIDLWKVRDARKGNDIIYLKTRIKCDPMEAYELFTKEEYLSWLAPKSNVEPMVGGKYEFFFSSEKDTTDCTLGCKITAAEPGKFIAFDWAGPSKYEKTMNRADPLTHVVVIFEPCDKELMKCTDVNLIHSGWGSTDEWIEAKKWFEKRWEEAFVELEKEAELIK
jgi:uncharacterized protein YndB with AHSA1/START domain